MTTQLRREQSYNNTFTSGGVNYNRVIYNSGTKYIKQSITPTTTGGNVVSVDQGTFKIVQRRKDLQEIIVTQSFQSDYSGEVVVFNDIYYTTDQSANTTIAINSATKTITITGANTLDNLYDYIKYWLTQNMSITNFMSASGKTIDIADYKIVGLQHLTTGTKLTSIQSTGIFTTTGAFTIDIIGNVIQDTPTNLSNVTISGDLTYNTNTALEISYTNCTINNVINTGTGIVDINLISSTANSTDAEINFIAKLIINFSQNFNIIGKYDTTSLGYTADVTTKTFTVPLGKTIKFAVWSLGYQTKYQTFDTTNGGGTITLELIANENINTTLDVSSYLAGIDGQINGNNFDFTFTSAMSLNIEQMKAVVHRISAQEQFLLALLSSSGTSTMEIRSDEIRINQPVIFLKRGPLLTLTDRVEMNGFINVGPAKIINPSYVINPSSVDGLYVTILPVKPTIDQSQLALAVRTEMEKTGNGLDVINKNIIKASKLIPANETF